MNRKMSQNPCLRFCPGKTKRCECIGCCLGVNGGNVKIVSLTKKWSTNDNR